MISQMTYSLPQRLRTVCMSAFLLATGTFAASIEAQTQRATPPIGTFVGRLDDSSTCISIIAGSSIVVAFVADSARSLSIPFSGARGAKSTVLSSSKGNVLRVRLSSKQAVGSITINKQRKTFLLDRAKRKAGLYRAAGKLGSDPLWIGWIALNGGRQCGVANTEKGIISPPKLDTTSQTFTAENFSAAVVKVEPDASESTIEDPGTTFSGGSGFVGGVGGFGGFSRFGGGQFNSGFAGGGVSFNGSAAFSGAGGFQGGFSGGGSNPTPTPKP